MRTSAVGRSNSRAGFTLAEVLVVMAVATVLLGLVVPRMDAWLWTNPEATARKQLSALLIKGREHALVKSRPAALVVETGGPRMWLQNSAGKRISKMLRLPEGFTFAMVHLPGDEPGDAEDRPRRVPLRIQPGGLVKEALIVVRQENRDAVTFRLRPFGTSLGVYNGQVDYASLHLAEAR